MFGFTTLFSVLFVRLTPLLADAIDDLAAESGEKKEEIRKAIMTSEAYDALYDFDSGLWQQGPAYFIDFFRRIQAMSA
jgi:hypothetical protein